MHLELVQDAYLNLSSNIFKDSLNSIRYINYFTTSIKEILADYQYGMFNFFDFEDITLMQHIHYHTSRPTGSPQSYYVSNFYPITFLTASNTRSAWNGLTIKSLAPDWIASITIACCPIAEHIITCALGSLPLIAFNA